MDMRLLNNTNSEIEMVVIGCCLLFLHEALIFFVIKKSTIQPKQNIYDFILHPSVVERISGIVLLGALPLILLRPMGSWQFWSASVSEFVFVAVVCVTIALICKWLSFRFGGIAHSVPGLELNSRTGGLIYNSLIWTGYLAAYEFLMRGLLFFPLIIISGKTTGIILNTVIYSLIHIKKGYLQTIGSIPFGVLLCFIALETNSFWPAYLIHLTLCLTMNWFLAERPSIKTPKYQEI